MGLLPSNTPDQLPPGVVGLHHVLHLAVQVAVQEADDQALHDDEVDTQVVGVV